MVKSDWGLKPIYDVIAMMKGSEAPDQWVVRGNHHDGWVFGAWDPAGGQCGFAGRSQIAWAQLAKTGWRPKRTIVYASWDGEEPGLIGSTEWAEQHGDELQKKAVIYVNSDTNGQRLPGRRGQPRPAAHDQPGLRRCDAIPETKVSVSILQRLRAGHPGARAFTDPSSRRRKPRRNVAAAAGDLPVGRARIGVRLLQPSCSTWGIATRSTSASAARMTRAGSITPPTTPSSTTSRFGDPTFEYGVALGQTVTGRLVLL